MHRHTHTHSMAETNESTSWFAATLVPVSPRSLGRPLSLYKSGMQIRASKVCMQLCAIAELFCTPPSLTCEQGWVANERALSAFWAPFVCELFIHRRRHDQFICDAHARTQRFTFEVVVHHPLDAPTFHGFCTLCRRTWMGLRCLFWRLTYCCHWVCNEMPILWQPCLGRTRFIDVFRCTFTAKYWMIWETPRRIFNSR